MGILASPGGAANRCGEAEGTATSGAGTRERKFLGYPIRRQSLSFLKTILSFSVTTILEADTTRTICMTPALYVVSG